LKGTAVVVFVVVLLAIGGTMALSGIYAGPQKESSNLFASPTSAREINPTNALKFAVSLNSSSTRQGGVFSVSLSLFNTLARANNVTGAENWRLTNASENGGAGGWNDSGAPIPNQPLTIQAQLIKGFTFNSTTGRCDPVFSTHLWMNRTGTDGKIELGMTGDRFNITTSYLGKIYQVAADAEGAESAECVTLSLPSGAVNTTFSGMFDCQC